jgi:hypothetical protein
MSHYRYFLYEHSGSKNVGSLFAEKIKCQVSACLYGNTYTCDSKMFSRKPPVILKIVPKVANEM